MKLSQICIEIVKQYFNNEITAEELARKVYEAEVRQRRLFKDETEEEDQIREVSA